MGIIIQIALLFAFTTMCLVSGIAYLLPILFPSLRVRIVLARVTGFLAAFITQVGILFLLMLGYEIAFLAAAISLCCVAVMLFAVYTRYYGDTGADGAKENPVYWRLGAFLLFIMWTALTAIADALSNSYFR